jgi:hypothetical protein
MVAIKYYNPMKPYGIPINGDTAFDEDLPNIFH